MCGFLTVIVRGRPVDMARLQMAADTIRHRGPDAQAVARFDLGQGEGAPLHAAMAHNRLAIIDRHARSDQPLTREKRTLAYNGEIYNFRALRADLVRNGARFTTEGDSEVLIELVTRRGVQGLEAANGMWAFTLLDSEARTLIAARDRYGKKPLFYYQDATTLCFASEMKAIFAFLGLRPQMRADAIASYLAHGWLFPGRNGETHIEGIREVPAGGSLTFDLAAWVVYDGPRLRLPDTPPAGHDDGAHLAATLEAAITDRLIADREVGLLLSGGVDSSLILSVLAHKGLAERVHCFVGDAGKSEDAHFARQCLEHLGLSGHVIPVDYGATSFERFLAVCRHQEKPFPLIGNVLGLPQLYAAIAAADVPVVLDGTGADEIFGGYPERTLPLAVAAACRQGDEAWVAATIEGFANAPRTRAVCAAAHAASSAEPPHPPLAAIRPEVPPEEPDLSHLLAPEVRDALSSDPLLTHTGPFAHALRLDATAGRMQEWLWQNDRTAMQFGVENRSPFLDPRFAPWLQTPYTAKISAPWLKLELRRQFDRFRPLPTQWRQQKQGFRWVYGRFLRQNRGVVLDLIANAEILRGRLDRNALVDCARRDHSVLVSEVLQRALCLAGVADQLDLRG